MLEPHAAAGIALAVAAATVGGLCSFVVRRNPHGVRSEKELIAALGSPLVAARPLAIEPLAEQLAAVQPLERLHELLSFCRARVVGAVLSPT
jgi:hypothetical protein